MVKIACTLITPFLDFRVGVEKGRVWDSNCKIVTVEPTLVELFVPLGAVNVLLID